MAGTTRTELGQHFSEGARLTWLRLAELGWTVSDLRRRLTTRGGEELAPGVAERALYGDVEASLRLAVQVLDLLGVDVRLWIRPPARKFTPPALRRSRPVPRRRPRAMVRPAPARR